MGDCRIDRDGTTHETVNVVAFVSGSDPWEFGSACWARTSDPLINSQLLYQLS